MRKAGTAVLCSQQPCLVFSLQVIELRIRPAQTDCSPSLAAPAGALASILEEHRQLGFQHSVLTVWWGWNSLA